jgi:hypothetical protein
MSGETRSPAERFALDGYLRVDRLIRPVLARRLCAYAFRMLRTGRVRSGDRMVPHTPALYGSRTMDELLAMVLPSVEQTTGLRLDPTYSYFRIYQRGDVLPPHSDRHSCEVSVSLTLGQETTRPWPLWIAGRRNTRPVSLGTGDALIYRGIECRHWRNAFRGRWQCQVFLHYVDRDGPNAGWKYDRRPELGLPAWTRREASGSAAAVPPL